ncbi:MAG: glycosyltransferase family 4 protein [Patescibacteria group bacterium]
MAQIDKKKILYFSTKSVYGGAQRYILDLIDYLPKDHYEIHVAAGGKGQLATAVIERNVPYHELQGLERDVNPLMDIRSLIHIWRLIRKIRPDIIHLNGSKVSVLGAISGRIAGVPHIVSSTHGWPFLEERPRWQRKLIKLIAKIASWFQDTIICVSELDYMIGIREHVANQKKLQQIHNGVDPRKHIFLDRSDARERLLKRQHIPRQDYIITGTLGEYTKNKGLHYLIEAARHIVDIQPNILFLLMGWGEEKEYLLERIAAYRLENQVIIVDALPEAFTYLKAFDIFIHPSVKEGFSYVLLEASLAELPIITTQVGGNPEIIENFKTGLLIQPRSPQEIISSVSHLIKNPDDRQSLGKAARTKVLKDFSIQAMVDATERAYERS